MWNRVLVDVGDAAVTANEKHVERNKRVPHPHGDITRFTEIEQHAVFRWHALAEHQALFALGIVQRQFHSEIVAFPRPFQSAAVRR